VTAYGFFLIALSKVAMTLIIGLGPLFFIGLLFQPTAGFFSAWLRQLANYFLVPLLVVMVNLLVMKLFSRAADAAVSVTEVAQIFPFLAMGFVTLLALASVLSIASGLAGGISLSSFGMGRFSGGLLKHVVQRLGRLVAKQVTRAGKKIARGAWNGYQNRKSNSIRPTRGKGSTNHP
jgi:type IV secretion system protein VirB6